MLTYIHFNTVILNGESIVEDVILQPRKKNVQASIRTRNLWRKLPIFCLLSSRSGGPFSSREPCWLWHISFTAHAKGTLCSNTGLDIFSHNWKITIRITLSSFEFKSQKAYNFPPVLNFEFEKCLFFYRLQVIDFKN